MKRFAERYRKVTKYIAIASLVLFLLSVFYGILMLNYYASNKSRGYARTIKCLDNTEYTVSDISYDDFVKRLLTFIEADSNACYAVKKDLRNLKETEFIDTMTVEFRVDSSGTNYSVITFFVPFDNDQVKLSGNFFFNSHILEENYKLYDGKLKLSVMVLDTQPIRVLFFRCWDYDEQRLQEKAQKYFREHYLDSVCQYDTQDTRNSFFFLLNWCYVHLYYVYFFIHFPLLWILIWYIYHCIYRSKEKRDEKSDIN